MARRSAVLVKKTKKGVRISRTETYLVNQKYMGDEPVFTDDNVDLARAYTWYGYMCSTNEARDFMQEYLKNVNRVKEAKMFAALPDVWIPKTACWIARMLSRGVKIDETTKKFFEDRLAKALVHSPVVEKKVEEKAPVISVQRRIAQRGYEIIGDIEQMIDKGEVTSIYEWMRSQELPALYAPTIVAYYTPILNELLDALAKADPQLVEAYSRMPKKKLEGLILMYSSIIDDANRYGQNTKKARVPRKPRKVSVEKKLKNLKYQKEDGNFKIASINPEKIIGAQELWTFNTKYKTLTVFRAVDRGGLQIKGTSIIGYDEKNSSTKRTGRKPEYFIDKVLNGGKITLRKLMDEMKGDANLAYRINENTILLKVS